MLGDAVSTRTYAQTLAVGCADALGGALVSAVLHGSLVLGDFVPGRSDVDVLVVVREPLSDGQVAAVRDAAGDPPARADLRFVTRTTAASPTPAPVLEAGLLLRPGRTPELEARTAEEPDVAVELSVARAHGRRLAGAAPASVIAPVPPAWLLQLGDRQLAAWQRLTGDAEHAELMVLTACRIWRFAIEGVHCSKTAAGRWALARDPSLVAVDQALRRRAVDPAIAIDPAGIARVLAVVRRTLDGS